MFRVTNAVFILIFTTLLLSSCTSETKLERIEVPDSLLYANSIETDECEAYFYQPYLNADFNTVSFNDSVFFKYTYDTTKLQLKPLLLGMLCSDVIHKFRNSSAKQYFTQKDVTLISKIASDIDISQHFSFYAKDFDFADDSIMIEIVQKHYEICEKIENKEKCALFSLGLYLENFYLSCLVLDSEYTTGRYVACEITNSYKFHSPNIKKNTPNLTAL